MRGREGGREGGRKGGRQEGMEVGREGGSNHLMFKYYLVNILMDVALLESKLYFVP